MVPFFVNLPLRYVRDEPGYVDMFLDLGLGPEWGLDAVAMQDFSLERHREVAGRFSQRGLRCSIHLPFLDLSPASLDDYVLQASRKRLMEAVQVCRVYEPRLLVGHPAYDPEGHKPFHSRWLERSLETWGGFCDAWPDHPPLHLENTFETDPEPIVELLDALDRDRVGACLDVGHWNSFARGHARQDLDRWLDALGRRLTHVHLHDNDGSFDQHVGLGRGNIPWESLFQGLARHGLNPTATLEPHTEQAFRDSSAFIQAHPQWFARLRGASGS